MKNILSILILGMIVCNGIGAIAVPNDKIHPGIQQNSELQSLYNDELDQYQTDYVENIFLPIGRLPDYFDPPIYSYVAQSFIPKKEILSKVALFVGRNNTTTHPLVIAIRDDLSADNLVSISINASEFIIQDFTWIEFNFDDLPVTINETYYIITYTDNITENYYIWGANNNFESYIDGCAWISPDGKNWVNESVLEGKYSIKLNPKYCRKQLLNNGNSKSIKYSTSPLNDNLTWDMCFMTYGRNEPPKVYIIKPKNALYIANEELFEFFEPVIFGIIKIIVDATDHSGIDVVEFFINDIYVGNARQSPYTWIWSDRAFFKHFLKIVATDTFGLTTETEIEVWKFF